MARIKTGFDIRVIRAQKGLRISALDSFSIRFGKYVAKENKGREGNESFCFLLRSLRETHSESFLRSEAGAHQFHSCLTVVAHSRYLRCHHGVIPHGKAVPATQLPLR